jgi:hypothetical protein
MNRLARRIAMATASVAVAGGAILGAGGSASAATPGAGQHVSSLAVNAQAVDLKIDSHPLVPGSNGGRRLDDNSQDYRWDGYRGWHHAENHHGHWYWYNHEHGQDYRWDGLTLYRWSDGHWVTDIQLREYGADFWHVDQLTFINS